MAVTDGWDGPVGLTELAELNDRPDVEEVYVKESELVHGQVREVWLRTANAWHLFQYSGTFSPGPSDAEWTHPVHRNRHTNEFLGTPKDLWRPYARANIDRVFEGEDEAGVTWADVAHSRAPFACPACGELYLEPKAAMIRCRGDPEEDPEAVALFRCSECANEVEVNPNVAGGYNWDDSPYRSPSNPVLHDFSGRPY